MADYEIYDLSDGWDDFLRQNIKMNIAAHTALAEEAASEGAKKIQLAAIQGNEKILYSLDTYMRGDMTIKIFPRQALRMFWVLIENCLYYKNELDKSTKKSLARKRALFKIKEACTADNFEEVKRIIDSISSGTKNKDAPSEDDTPKGAAE